MDELKKPRASTVFGLTPPAKSGSINSILSEFTEQFRTQGGWNPKQTLYSVPFPLHRWLDKDLVIEITHLYLDYVTGVISEHALDFTLYSLGQGKNVFTLNRAFDATDLLADLNAQSVAYGLTWTLTAVLVQNVTRYRFTVANAAADPCTIASSFITLGQACHGVSNATEIIVPALSSYDFPAFAPLLESMYYYFVLYGPTYVNSFGSGGMNNVGTIYPEGGGILDTVFELDPPYAVRTGDAGEWKVGVLDQYGRPVTSNNYGQPPGIGLSVRQAFTDSRLSAAHK